MGAKEETTINWTLLSSYYSLDELLTRMTYICEREGYKQTKAALDYMLKMHKGQFRKQTWFSEKRVEYVVHPLTIACQAYALGIRQDEILAAILLHDVCEDCAVTKDQLPVNNRTRELVSLVTFVHPDTVSKSEAKFAYFEAMKQDEDAMLIKILDRCNNVATMSSCFSKEKLIEYVEETQDYIYPILELLLESEEYHDMTALVQYQIVSIVETTKNLMMRQL